LRENLIDIRMDLRQLPITRSLTNRMGTRHGRNWYARQVHKERHMSAVRIALRPPAKGPSFISQVTPA